MDAASNTGVDDVREIIDGVHYAPLSARYKIYIIDEVHMLSRNAFNALLKTLEEPPESVKFVFATTEFGKCLSPFYHAVSALIYVEWQQTGWQII